ncbi:MAG: hypothetical protein BGO63_18860 [Candidatus Accumulibacter sp. 66-26]|nr:hypothetical protein [Accumulibacter sp.]OJW51949.1 MAG: hypothetical protein BGO63_18860 [Candidatus Accumulibacter sp. 66-26]
MKAFLLIVAALILPFVSIGSFTAASLLRMRDGAAAGALPGLLTGVGFVLIAVLAYCIFSLHRMHVAKRNAAPSGE